MMFSFLFWSKKQHTAVVPVFGPEKPLLEVFPHDVISLILQSKVLTNKERARFAMTSSKIASCVQMSTHDFLQNEKQHHLDREYRLELNKQCVLLDAYHQFHQDPSIDLETDLDYLYSLARKGANLSIVDDHGHSLLHLLTMLSGTCGKNNRMKDEWIIEHIDWNIRDDKGKRAYEYLFYEQEDFSGQLIYPYIKHGLPPHINIDGQLLFDHIQRLDYFWFQKECFAYLEKHFPDLFL
jgi:hypothetical protein